MSHTPAPWLIDKNDMYSEARITTQNRLDESTVPIAEVSVGFWDEKFDNEQHANARLIASAPELLEALRVAMAFIDSHVADPDITTEMAQRYAELINLNPHEIIAKAEGK